MLRVFTQPQPIAGLDSEADLVALYQVRDPFDFDEVLLGVNQQNPLPVPTILEHALLRDLVFHRHAGGPNRSPHLVVRAMPIPKGCQPGQV